MGAGEDLAAKAKPLHLHNELDRPKHDSIYSDAKTLKEVNGTNLVEYIRDIQSSSPSQRTFLEKTDPFFKNCEQVFDNVKGPLGLNQACFDNMRQFACGDLSLPVIVLRHPNRNQVFKYREMVESTDYLQFVQEFLSYLGLDVNDVVVMELFPFLTDGEAPLWRTSSRMDIPSEVFKITEDFFRTFKPAIVISCHFACSREEKGKLDFFRHPLAHNLSSTWEGAENSHVKQITIDEKEISIVQAFHPSTFWKGSANKTRKVRKIAWMFIIARVFEPCVKEHLERLAKRTVNAASPQSTSNVPSSATKSAHLGSVKEKTKEFTTEFTTEEKKKPRRSPRRQVQDSPASSQAPYSPHTPFSKDMASDVHLISPEDLRERQIELEDLIAKFGHQMRFEPIPDDRLQLLEKLVAIYNQMSPLEPLSVHELPKSQSVKKVRPTVQKQQSETQSPSTPLHQSNSLGSPQLNQIDKTLINLKDKTKPKQRASSTCEADSPGNSKLRFRTSPSGSGFTSPFAKFEKTPTSAEYMGNFDSDYWLSIFNGARDGAGPSKDKEERHPIFKLTGLDPLPTTSAPATPGIIVSDHTAQRPLSSADSSSITSFNLGQGLSGGTRERSLSVSNAEDLRRTRSVDETKRQPASPLDETTLASRPKAAMRGTSGSRKPAVKRSLRE